MATTKRKVEIRWPSAVVLIVGIIAVAAVYVLVPEHREEIALGVGGVFAVVLAFMRRILGLAAPAVLALCIAIPSCTPAQKAAFEGAMLSALEMAAKAAGRVLLGEAERALKFETSGGEEP
jgi:hypothetical protein